MFERYTGQARRVIFFARYEASRFGSPAIETEHLLLGLAREDGPLLTRFLAAEEPAQELYRQVKARVKYEEPIDTSVELPLGDEAKGVLQFAFEESGRLSDSQVGTEHLLLGLLRAEGTLAETILRENGLDLARAREALAPKKGEGHSPGGEGQAVGGADAASNEPADPASSAAVRIEHIGIATPRIDEALRFWRDALGLEVRHTEVVEEQGVRVAMLPAGEPRVELLEPTGPSSPVAKFLEKRGAGLHHVAVRVPDIRAALARLKEQGMQLIDETPRAGAGGCLVAFVHPRSAGGVLLELVEHAPEPHDSLTERS